MTETKETEKLQNEIEILRLAESSNILLKQAQRIKQLEAENLRLREALEYYAVEDLFEPVYGQRLSEKTSKLVYELGNIARKALSKVEGDGE